MRALNIIFAVSDVNITNEHTASKPRTRRHNEFINNFSIHETSFLTVFGLLVAWALYSYHDKTTATPKKNSIWSSVCACFCLFALLANCYWRGVTEIHTTFRHHHTRQINANIYFISKKKKSDANHL